MDAAVRKYQQDDPNNLVTQLVDNLQWNLKVGLVSNYQSSFAQTFCVNVVLWKQNEGRLAKLSPWSLWWRKGKNFLKELESN